MIQGFFFDLDGTLVDTYEADYRAYRDAIVEVLGLDIDQEAFNRTHGQELRQKLLSLAPGATEGDAQTIADAKKRHYKKYLDKTVPNKALISFLANFSDYHAMVLVTTAKRDNAISVLRQYDLEQYFSYTVFGDEVTMPKPHPESYLLALERSGLAANDVIAFEDTDTGIAAAEAAGLQVVHVKDFAV